MQDYTLSPDEMDTVVEWIQTAKRFGWPLHVRIENGVRIKVGDETWSLPMGQEYKPSGVIELPDERG